MPVLVLTSWGSMKVEDDIQIVSCTDMDNAVKQLESPLLVMGWVLVIKEVAVIVERDTNTTVGAWIYVPERKGRTNRDIDMLFAARVPPRKMGPHDLNQVAA